MFWTPKLITLKHSGRGRGGFLVGSCFLNHDAKWLKEKQKRNNKNNQGQIALERVRGQKSR